MSYFPNKEDNFIFILLVHQLDLFKSNFTWTWFSCNSLIYTCRSSGHDAHVVHNRWSSIIALFSSVLRCNGRVDWGNALEMVIWDVAFLNGSILLEFLLLLRCRVSLRGRLHQIDWEISSENQLNLDCEVSSKRLTLSQSQVRCSEYNCLFKLLSALGEEFIWNDNWGEFEIVQSG